MQNPRQITTSYCKRTACMLATTRFVSLACSSSLYRSAQLCDEIVTRVGRDATYKCRVRHRVFWIAFVLGLSTVLISMETYRLALLFVVLTELFRSWKPTHALVIPFTPKTDVAVPMRETGTFSSVLPLLLALETLVGRCFSVRASFWTYSRSWKQPRNLWKFRLDEALAPLSRSQSFSHRRML